MKDFFKTWKKDLPASLVVFLVALPLCLGIGLASTQVKGDIEGLPNLFSGLIAGVVGGIIVGSLSGSRLGVSGPAAGLITIVTAAILTLGSFQAFLVAVVIAGVFQLIAGFLKAGVLSKYFPSSVIKGMLAAIGLTLILKEIPHAFGYDADFIGDDSFVQPDGHNTFSELGYMLNALQPGAIIISMLSLGVLILFETKFMKKISLFKILPAALFVVLIGVGLNALFMEYMPNYVLTGDHLVQLPVPENLDDVKALFSFPDFSYLSNPSVYGIAITLALVGSLETLLSVEATDKLDPEKHHTPTNRELKAQGVGNIVSGLLGGLPITQVIVRSSANINSGAKSKLSAIVHGILLFSTIIFIPNILNLIPLASLAGILLMIGYKLAKIPLIRQMYKLGWEQFLPFAGTITVVLFTDLLTGIFAGIMISFFFILKRNYQNNYQTESLDDADNKKLKITFSDEVTFLNKASIFDLLDRIDPNSEVILDGTQCHRIDHDTLEVIREFKNYGAIERNINVEVINMPELD